MAAGGAPGPGEAVGQDAALQIAPELFVHVVRHTVGRGIGLMGQGEVGLEMLADDAVERGGLGPAAPVGLGMRNWGPVRRNRPADPPRGRLGLGGQWGPRTSTGTGCVWASRRREGWGRGMGRTAGRFQVGGNLPPQLRAAFRNSTLPGGPPWGGPRRPGGREPGTRWRPPARGGRRSPSRPPGSGG